jgi:hypothetical protein
MDDPHPGTLFKSEYKSTKCSWPSGSARQHDWKRPVIRAKSFLCTNRFDLVATDISILDLSPSFYNCLSVRKNNLFLTQSLNPRYITSVDGVSDDLPGW